MFNSFAFFILNAPKSNGLLSLDSMRKTDYQEYENFGNNQQFHFQKSAVCLLDFRQSEYYFSQGFEPKKTSVIVCVVVDGTL